MYLLYIDLATFFPAVHRGVAAVGELCKGLPTEFVDTVGAIFGELTGEYDSACLDWAFRFGSTWAS